MTTRAIGYTRVSTDEQARTGYGLTDQRTRVAAEIAHRGWESVDVVADEGESGKDLDRPGIRSVLTRLAAGDADALVITKLDRLTRSVRDFADVLEWADRCGVALVILDLGIDTSTPTGRLVAGVVAQVAQWERETIADRTRAAAAVRRAEGKRMGREGVRDTSPAVAARIVAAREAGATWQAIADDLNSEGVPTVRGGAEWRVSSVQSAAGYVRPAARPKRVALPPTRRRSRSA